MSDFIVVAKQKSQEHNVQHLCDFIIADINESVKIEKGYDVVILGAVGDVLGNQEETLLKLSATIKEEGHILIDDGYAKSTSEGPYLSKEK
jgi:2-polyprenyl-3-methyl-5-hydroxy-6-metoxy-1,4-benzoquinol methylase